MRKLFLRHIFLQRGSGLPKLNSQTCCPCRGTFVTKWRGASRFPSTIQLIISWDKDLVCTSPAIQFQAKMMGEPSHPREDLIRPWPSGAESTSGGCGLGGLPGPVWRCISPAVTASGFCHHLSGKCCWGLPASSAFCVRRCASRGAVCGRSPWLHVQATPYPCSQVLGIQREHGPSCVSHLYSKPSEEEESPPHHGPSQKDDETMIVGSLFLLWRVERKSSGREIQRNRQWQG